MNQVNIPDDVRRFVLTSIPSVPFLEALLLLRSEEQKIWNAKQVATRLYMSEKAAIALLEELHAAGLLALDGQDAHSYRYSPALADVRHIVDQLAETYSRHLVEVSNLIHSTNGKKAQQFADAFKLRKDS